MPNQVDVHNKSKDIRYVADLTEGYLAIRQDNRVSIVPLSDIVEIAAILKAGRNEVAARGRKQAAIANFGIQGSLKFGERK